MSNTDKAEVFYLEETGWVDVDDVEELDEPRDVVKMLDKYATLQTMEALMQLKDEIEGEKVTVGSAYLVESSINIGLRNAIKIVDNKIKTLTDKYEN